MKSLENELLLALAMLRRHINPLQSPTCRLPSELLPLVVSNLESDTDLVHATHVSHHWRSTLYTHPSLWSHLDFEDTGRAIPFLEKSKSTPLHVTLVGDSRVAPSVEPLRPHTTRIVTLVLFDCAPQRVLLSQSMPSLRRLEIIGADEPPVDGTISLSLPSVTSLALHDVYPTPLHVPQPPKFHGDHTSRWGVRLQSPRCAHTPVPLLGDTEELGPQLCESRAC